MAATAVKPREISKATSQDCLCKSGLTCKASDSVLGLAYGSILNRGRNTPSLQRPSAKQLAVPE